mgnify:FL=1
MYTFDSRIRYSETDETGALSLLGVINYLQDCSTFQSEDIGLGVEYLEEKKRAWLLSSWRIVIDRYPVLGERIKIGTWATSSKGIYGYRDFVIMDQDGNYLVRAESIWFFCDTEKMVPVRVMPEDVAAYGNEEALDLGKAPRKILIPEEYEEGIPVIIATHHLDTNHHVNNAQYVDIAREAVPCTKMVKGIRADYKKAAVLGEILVPRVTKTGEDEWTVVLADEVCEVRAVVWLQYGEHKSNKEYGS